MTSNYIHVADFLENGTAQRNCLLQAISAQNLPPHRRVQLITGQKITYTYIQEYLFQIYQVSVTPR
jgi:hypothetical protein